MTEAEWLGCEDPGPMLTFLQARASDRKLRLFAVACAKRGMFSLRSPEALERSPEALETVEEYVDQRATGEELSRIVARTMEAPKSVIERYKAAIAGDLLQ